MRNHSRKLQLIFHFFLFIFTLAVPVIPANCSSSTMPIAIPTSQSSSAAAPTIPAPVVPPAPRNPVRLSVAARDHHQPSAGPSTASSVRVQADSIPSGDASIAPAGGEDAEALKRAAIRKAQLQRRVERWMDKLMEETVDRATFKKSVSAWPILDYNIHVTNFWFLYYIGFALHPAQLPRDNTRTPSQLPLLLSRLPQPPLPPLLIFKALCHLNPCSNDQTQRGKRGRRILFQEVQSKKWVG